MDPISTLSNFQLEHLKGMYEGVVAWFSLKYIYLYLVFINAIKTEMHELSLYQYLIISIIPEV